MTRRGRRGRDGVERERGTVAIRAGFPGFNLVRGASEINQNLYRQMHVILYMLLIHFKLTAFFLVKLTCYFIVPYLTS